MSENSRVSRKLAPVSDNFFLIPLGALIACIVIGLFAPPLPRAVPAKVINYGLGFAAVFGLLALAGLCLGSLDWCAIFGVVCEGIFMLCVWLAHSGPSTSAIRWGGGGGGPPDDDRPPPPSPHDWDEFDRLRAGWSARQPGPAPGREPVGA